MKCLLILLILISSNAFADDKVHIIEKPTFDGIPLSKHSNLNGVCKALGYEKSVDGAAVVKETWLSHKLSLTVNDNGLSQYGSNFTKVITQLICVNKVDHDVEKSPMTSKFESFAIVKDPTHSQSGFWYSRYSDVNFICIDKNYDDGIESAYTQSYISEADATLLLIPKEKGEISVNVVKKDSGEYYVSSVICKNPKASTEPSKVKTVENISIFRAELPSLGDYVFIEASTPIDGVCRAIGFNKAIKNSLISKKHNKENPFSVHLNGEGKVVNTYHSNKIVGSVLCINKEYEYNPEAKKGVFQETYQLDSPLHSSTGYFSVKSDINGVCKHYKYESAAALVGSKNENHSKPKYKSVVITKGIALIVDKDEKLIGSKAVSEEVKYVETYKTVVCMNEVKPISVK